MGIVLNAKDKYGFIGTVGIYALVQLKDTSQERTYTVLVKDTATGLWTQPYEHYKYAHSALMIYRRLIDGSKNL